MLRTLAVFVGCGAVALSNANAQQVDFEALGDEAVQRVQEYLRVNTINPPGNESRAVEFFAAIFEAVRSKCVSQRMWCGVLFDSRNPNRAFHHSLRCAWTQMAATTLAGKDVFLAVEVLRQFPQ